GHADGNTGPRDHRRLCQPAPYFQSRPRDRTPDTDRARDAPDRDRQERVNLSTIGDRTMLEWVKAFHIISVIAWMAGLLYLPRLFVYHAEAETGSVQSETFKTMERRLYRAITTPAMIATWVFGLWLIHL